jgi:hypothetical protein
MCLWILADVVAGIITSEIILEPGVAALQDQYSRLISLLLWKKRMPGWTSCPSLFMDMNAERSTGTPFANGLSLAADILYAGHFSPRQMCSSNTGSILYKRDECLLQIAWVRWLAFFSCLVRSQRHKALNLIASWLLSESSLLVEEDVCRRGENSCILHRLDGAIIEAVPYIVVTVFALCCVVTAPHWPHVAAHCVQVVNMPLHLPCFGPAAALQGLHHSTVIVDPTILKFDFLGSF